MSVTPLPHVESDYSLLRRLFAEHGRRHLAAYAAAAVLMAFGAAATGFSAYLLKPVLNHMVEASQFGTLRTLAWSVFALFALRGLATWGYTVILSRTGNRIVAGVQTRLFDHLVRQDMRFFQDRRSSEFMSRLALAATGVRDTLQSLITSAARDALTLLGLIAVMLVQDPLMSAIALSTAPITGLVLGRLIRRIRKHARRSFEGSSDIMEIMQETVLGARIVKSFNLEEMMRARMHAAVARVRRSANDMAASMAVSSPLSDVLAGLAIGAVIFYGSWRVTIAHADPGSFFSFVAALLLAYDPAKRLTRLKLELQNGLTGARMISEVLDQPAIEEPVPGAPPLRIGAGRIVFENVRFGYREGESVLEGIDLVAEPDMTTAFVGPSGGGKSTIISLIQRFYTPDAGRILIDEQDIALCELTSLRAGIAFVAQDVYLFRGTIRENIALGRPDASFAEIEEAARKAHAHDFIMGFANGYEANAGEQGAQLSGGQRQRIAIARAILKNAPIILLDEPTAALDSESEREVQKALDELRVGRTTLVVAHRLQTIVNADRIYVIEDGRAMESGTHSELIARRGTYRNFFAAQFGEVDPLRPSPSVVGLR
jgi:subfamily B ATP-binding cassette protein MsbA